MKIKSIRVISILLALIISITCFSASVLATDYSMNDEQWESYWESYKADGKAVYIAPGSDDTEMRFSWFGKSTNLKPYVMISKNADMSSFTKYYGDTVSGVDVEFSNHVTVTGLEKGTTYYYICCDGNEKTEVKSFNTVASGASFSAVFVSDLHVSGETLDAESLSKGANNLSNVFAAANNKEDISLIISGGDQADAGRTPEYIGSFASPVIKNIPFASTIGNHDVKAKNYKYIMNNANRYTDAYSKSLLDGDYWFVKGNALFLMIDSTNSSATDHYNFVEKAVAANPNVKWRVAVFHHDLYGGHNKNRESENKLLRIMLTPIFDKFAVDLVLMGHSHIFSRSHVLYGNKVAQNTSGLSSINNPKGTIFLVSGSVNRPRTTDETKSDWIDVDYVSDADVIYNIINFGDDKLSINTYTLGNDEVPVETFTIEKTGTNGGHPEKNVPFWYGAVKILSTVYNIINNISREIGYLQK